MFEVDRREQVRTQLLDQARDDERIVGAAITGSAASDHVDRWSDIDLFLGVADGVEVEDVLEDWSSFVYRELGALHHFDLRPSLWRVTAWGAPPRTPRVQTHYQRRRAAGRGHQVGARAPGNDRAMCRF
jgi:hypothetical protein